MRVISGEAKGRRFAAPKLDAVRPTSDRVREAIFDVVSHLGGVRGCRVLDLFAGSGAFGIEALSRGAVSATFVEQNRIVTDQIRTNLAAVGLSDRDARLVTGDAVAFCRGRAPRLSASESEAVDVTFCDPPYAYTNWERLLAVIPGDLVVLEHRRTLEMPEALETYRVYRYGSTLVTVAQRREATSKTSAAAAVRGRP